MPRRTRIAVLVLAVVVAGVVAVLTLPTPRSHAADAAAVTRLLLHDGDAPSDAQVARASANHPADGRAGIRATGRARDVLDAARSQLGVHYELGARPRHRWSLAMVGSRPNRLGFDCSTLVAYALLEGADIWPGGSIAHTDEIWTQDGRLPLTATPARTRRVVRGTGAHPPPGGYQPGDLLFRRSGAGGWWGHVAIVSERGYVIEALPPDVHETTRVETFLGEGDRLGWMRIRDLDRS